MLADSGLQYNTGSAVSLTVLRHAQQCHWHRCATNIVNILRKFEAICKKALTRVSGAPGVLYDGEIQRSRISYQDPFNTRLYKFFETVMAESYEKAPEPHRDTVWKSSSTMQCNGTLHSTIVLYCRCNGHFGSLKFKASAPHIEDTIHLKT
jgi:hypothetical protein